MSDLLSSQWGLPCMATSNQRAMQVVNIDVHAA